MPRHVDPLASFLRGLSDDVRRDFHAAVLRPLRLEDKPFNDVYADVRSGISKHPHRPTWTQMRDYKCRIKALREQRLDTAAAAEALVSQCVDLHGRIVSSHVPYDEWNLAREPNPSKLLQMRSIDLSFCATAVWYIMHYASKTSKWLHEKEAKQRRDAFEQVCGRLCRELACKACSNVVTRARDECRAAALGRLQAALLAWVRARVAERRGKKARLREVIAHNRRAVATKVRGPERV